MVEPGLSVLVDAARAWLKQRPLGLSWGWDIFRWRNPLENRTEL